MNEKKVINWRDLSKEVIDGINVSENLEITLENEEIDIPGLCTDLQRIKQILILENYLIFVGENFATIPTNIVNSEDADLGIRNLDIGDNIANFNFLQIVFYVEGKETGLKFRMLLEHFGAKIISYI